MNKFADKVERLKVQQEWVDNIGSQRQSSDVYCPGCNTFILKLKKETANKRKTIKTACPNPECNGDIKIVYHTNQSKAARVFAIEFNKTE
jgi:hypothetical protein